MISEKMINDKFISEELRKGVTKVKQLQSEVVQQVLTSRSGRLFSSLQDRNFFINQKGEKSFVVSVSILNYLRFNEIRGDMQTRRKLHLYNRIIWGVLYGETLNNLKYGLTEEIREQIRKQLQEEGIQLEIQF
jgi:hypothetical protein